MRTLARLLFALCIVALSSGPMLAAPLSVSSGPTIAAADHTPASPLSRAVKWLSFSLAVFGAIAIRDTGSIAKKFVTRAGQASGDYKDGVTGAGGRFEAAAKASEGNYENGVTSAIGRKAYGKGLNGSGAKFEKNATSLGATRYGPGVQNAQDAYASGVQPYLDRLKSLDLPPKGPRRSPQNQQRSTAVQMALGALKEGK